MPRPVTGPPRPPHPGTDPGAVAPQRPWWRRQWPLLAVLAVLVAGLVLSGLGYVRRGPALVGGAGLLAAALRFVLSDADAGLLAVRRKGVDVVVLGVLGLAVVVLTLTISPIVRR